MIFEHVDVELHSETFKEHDEQHHGLLARAERDAPVSAVAYRFRKAELATRGIVAGGMPSG